MSQTFARSEEVCGDDITSRVCELVQLEKDSDILTEVCVCVMCMVNIIIVTVFSWYFQGLQVSR